jgi:hypothetical protein
MSKSLLRWTVIAVSSYLQLSAQTRIDLRTQSKSVDFSNADTTKPAKTGNILPAACSAGELFISLTAPAGTNTFVCTTANTWVPQNGGLPALSLDTGTVLSTNANYELEWAPFGGDMIGSPNDMRVIGLRGRRISSAMPFDGQTLVWNATMEQWEPQQPAAGGAGILCVSQSSNGAAYTCSTDALSPYTTGAVIYWITGLNGGGGATTLNINGLGPKAVKQADGATDPSPTDIVQGRMYSLWYDGFVFRLTTSSAPAERPRTVDYAPAKCHGGEASSAFNTEADSAPDAKCTGTANQPIYGVLEFTDTAIAAVQDSFSLPDANIQTAAVNLWWRTPATSGSAVWQLQTACSSTLTSGNWGSAQAAVSAAPGAADTWTAATLTVDVSACAGKHFFWRLFRDPAHASDTIANATDVGRVLFSIQ